MSEEIYEKAEVIGTEISKIAELINSAYWVRTGKQIPTDDYLPEIVAAVIYVQRMLNKEKTATADGS